MKLMRGMLVFGLLTSNSYAGIVKDLLFDMRMEAERCTVLYVSSLDENQVLGSKSICDSYIIASPRKAYLEIRNSWYTAIIKESRDADGGDLDNLTILNRSGKVVATRKNIPSCGNIVFALADGKEFVKIRVEQ